MKKHYIYAEVPESVKKKAKRAAKREDMSFRQWVTKVLREAVK